MQEIRYADAGMDMRKLILFLMRRVWMVLLAMAAGAGIGAAVYAAAAIVPTSEREYRALSKIYLDFAPDETGEVYQAYNGYTWNDLMATDPILDGTMRYLPGGYTREEVLAATKAEILSDLRLLTITVTTNDAESCDAILAATGRSLTDRGQAAKEFRNIEVIRTTKAALVVADSRMAQAAGIGLAVSAALVLFGLLLYYTLDDRIFVASDFRQATDAPFVGYTGAGERLEREYEAALAHLGRRKGKIAVLSLRQEEPVSEARLQEVSEADGVVLQAVYGKVHAVYVQYMIEQLKIRECPLAGVAIGGADGQFLDRYYGGVLRGRNGAESTTAGFGSREGRG